jgi:two-component system, chemotaxis family, protein-glutamate methylesterase/glutaminase
MEKGTPVRVLIVDDSELVRSILRDILSHDPGIEVVGEADSGEKGVELTATLKPDLITMDIQMPGMDGFAATEQIMAYHPTPILIFSSAINKSEQYTSFKAISLGALDVMSKPDITAAGFAQIADHLIRKVKMLSRITTISHIRGKLKRPEEPPAQPAAARGPRLEPKPFSASAPLYDVLVVGASTGGPSTLEHFLSALPSSLPLGVCIVQHISRGFVGSLAEWLSGKVQIKVRVAEDGEEIRKGHVYFAPDDVQMQVQANRRIALRPDLPPWGEHKPSVNHLFTSAAEAFGSRAIGVILTGMGDDGAVGLKAIRDRGGHTIAQNQATSLIFGMPKSAIDLGAAVQTLPLEAIAGDILSVLGE